MFELAPDQKNQVSAIGNDSRMPLAVRRLAWLAVRASEGLSEARVAGAVGLPLDCTRYWLRVIESQGASFFDRFLNGSGSPNRTSPPVSIEELRTANGFHDEEGEFVSALALRLFDALGTVHRLGSHQRGVLENAALLHGLGGALLSVGEDGVFFSVLDPVVQNLPEEDKRVLAALLSCNSGRVSARSLRDSFGISKREAPSTLQLIALLRIAVALNASRSQSTVIYRTESSQVATYLILKGTNAAADGVAAEEAARLWRKVTGIPLRAITQKRTRLPGGRQSLSLYRARLKSPGIQPTDSMATAGRKTMRFLLNSMLRQENRVYYGQDPEALHKMRVNTRRLRSALRVFGSAFDKSDLKPFVKRFRELGRDLGVLRDHDVLLEHLERYVETLASEEQRAISYMIDYFKRKRLDALIVTREYVRSRRYLKFIRSFHDFVEEVEDPHEAKMVSRVSFAGPIQFYERIAAIREQGQDLKSASMEDLHELRIRFKRLRYTIDFYSDVLEDSVASIYPVLKKIQDHLGALQDAERACEMVDSFLAEATPEDGVVRTAVETYRLRRVSEQEPLVVSFPELWETFENPQMRTSLALAVSHF